MKKFSENPQDRVSEPCPKSPKPEKNRPEQPSGKLIPENRTQQKSYCLSRAQISLADGEEQKHPEPAQPQDKKQICQSFWLEGPEEPIPQARRHAQQDGPPQPFHGQGGGHQPRRRHKPPARGSS